MTNLVKVTSLRPGQVCKNGHQIRTADDIIWRDHGKVGKAYSRCKMCERDAWRRSDAWRRQRMKSEGRRVTLESGLKWEFQLDCSHSALYSVGKPGMGDTVFCYRCGDYSVTVPYAKKAKSEPDTISGRSADGVERQPLLEHSFGSPWPDPLDTRSPRMPGCSY